MNKLITNDKDYIEHDIITDCDCSAHFLRQLYIFYYVDDWDEGTTEISPSYTKAELMDAYPRIKNSCYDCHASALTVVR